jgi:hypothetical protein
MGKKVKILQLCGLALIAAVAALSLAPHANAADGDFRVTLLGTGTPVPSPERFGPPRWSRPAARSSSSTSGAA